MVWGTYSMDDLRYEFVRLCFADGANIRELCRRFGVAPKTGYKWLGRFRLEGRAGLCDRSRRPVFSPGRCSGVVEDAVLEVRARHPAWGGRKIAAVLERRGVMSPAPSTITAILQRHGVETGQSGGGAKRFIRFEHEAPNDLWQMDFKGSVGLAHGGRLHPLTVLDDHSRYALVLSACTDQQTATVRDRLVTAFRYYGLPRTIITDNGSPWGDGPGSPWTPLGVFLIEQGIRIAHSAPYHPQTMGKDERFHRSLKAEVLGGPAFADALEAEQAFRRWRTLYNTERPHEALAMRTPAERYRSSPRSFNERVVPFDYAPADQVVRVREKGYFTFKGHKGRVSKAFRGQDIALRPTADDGLYNIFFRHQIINLLDLRSIPRKDQTVTYLPEQVLPISQV